MFNGMSVTAGEYARLMSMQRQALKLDVLMRKMVETMGVENLNKSEKWHKLVALRKSVCITYYCELCK